MASLVACPDCGRHIRRSEGVCPFCSAQVASRISGIPERTMPTVRLSRAGLVAFAAAASVGAVGCEDNGSHVVHYGAPMFLGDSAPNTGGASSAGGNPSGGGGPNTGGKDADSGADAASGGA